MKYAQKWMVVPFNLGSNHNLDLCPTDKLQNDLSEVLHKNTDMHSKVNEYNQTLAKYQKPMHPIVPPSNEPKPIIEKTPYRKMLHFEDDDDDDDNEYTHYPLTTTSKKQFWDATVFRTPIGLDPMHSIIKSNSTPRKPSTVARQTIQKQNSPIVDLNVSQQSSITKKPKERKGFVRDKKTLQDNTILGEESKRTTRAQLKDVNSKIYNQKKRNLVLQEIQKSLRDDDATKNWINM